MYSSEQTQLQVTPAAPRLDLRPLMFAVAVWATAWLGTARNSDMALMGIAVGLFCALVSWKAKRWLLLALALAALVSLSTSWLRVTVIDTSPLQGWAKERAYVVLQGKVGAGRSGQGNFGQSWWRAVLEVSAVQGRGESWRVGQGVTLFVTADAVKQWEQLAPGSEVQISARLDLNPDFGQYQVLARAREPPQILAAPGVVESVVERLHQGLRDSVSQLAAAPQALVPALVVGDISRLDSQLQEDFKATGLTHLTAVSGSNLTILLACALFVAARSGVRGWWLRGVAICCVVFFVLLCRGEPSVLRAAAMGSVGLLSLGWGKGSQALRYLAWSIVFLILADPWLSRSVGFALSVAATAGIVLFARPWANKLTRWLPLWLAEALSVPLAAQLVTQPIVTAISGQISVVAVFANLLAAPLVAPATILGFIATAIAPFWLPLAQVPGQMAGWFAQGLCWIAQTSAQLPGACFSWPVNPFSVVLVGAFCLSLLLILPKIWAHIPLALSFIALLILLLFRPPTQPGWPPDDWFLVSCDVGQGDATLIRTGVDSAILIDAGPETQKLQQCVSSLGIRTIPIAILTHLHADHVTGLSAVADKVQRIATSSVHSPRTAWAQLQSLGKQMDTLGSGDRFSCGQVQVEVLSQHAATILETPADSGESSEENNASLVLQFKSGTASVLIAGDVQEAGQDEAVSRAELDSDILLIPHHGSAHQSAAFLKEIAPDFALISVGAGNSYGHPAKSLLQKLQPLSIYRTDLHGAIAVSQRDGQFLITTQRTAPP